MKRDEMEGDELSAQKEALRIVGKGLRERSIRRGVPTEPDGNVGEVMEREPEIEAAEVEESEPVEEEAPAPEMEKRTVLESFVPRVVRPPAKRGPGRPRKVY